MVFLSPLASRGIVTTLLFLMCLVCNGRAFADWAVTYSPSPSFPVSDVGLCPANSTVTKTKTLTVTAKVTWTGTGTAPTRIIVSEAATVSWSAQLATLQGGGDDGPPPAPSGTISGSGSTGLTDVATKKTNPWTNKIHGESITGTRETVYTVPSSGVLTLPSVTLTATATASPGANSTGTASVTLSSYGVTVPDGSAHAAASADLKPSSGSGWEISEVMYLSSGSNDGTWALTALPGGPPGLTVSLHGVGLETDKTVGVYTRFEYTGPGEPGPCLIYGPRTVSGDISSKFFSAESSVNFEDSHGMLVSFVSGSAPTTDPNTNEPVLSYSKEVTSSSISGTPIIVFTTHSDNTATYITRLKAKASTDLGQQ